MNRFADMLLTPASPSDIAKALGRTVSSIAHQIGDMSTQKTKTGKALAALVDAKRAAAAKPANHRATWDAAADKDLLIAFAAGKSPVEIASATGRTVAAINARLHALDMLSFDKDTMTYLTVPKVWFKVQV